MAAECNPWREQDPMERAVPVLPADDLRVAKDFYATKLGFRVLFEASDEALAASSDWRKAQFRSLWIVQWTDTAGTLACR